MNIIATRRKSPLHPAALARIAEAAVSAASHVPPQFLRQRRRGDSEAAFARQVAMYLAHVGFGLTMTQVGISFGRDRTTVRHACALVENRRDLPAFEFALTALEAGMASLARRLADVSLREVTR